MTEKSDPVTVLVYSDDPAVRERLVLAAGRRPAEDLPEIEYVECASEAEVFHRVGEQRVDLCVLDGEAWPAGGLGVCRQLKDEIRDCPPVVVLTGRADDRWLASWCQADGVVSHPLDPFAVEAAVTDLLRRRLTRSGAPTG